MSIANRYKVAVQNIKRRTELIKGAKRHNARATKETLLRKASVLIAIDDEPVTIKSKGKKAI
jgi:hypothetical protein